MCKFLINVIYLCCFNLVRVVESFIFRHCRARFIKIIGLIVFKFK